VCTGRCKRRNATANDFIRGAREPVRRSVIAMNRCILCARSQINFNNPELHGLPLFSAARFAVHSLSPLIFITWRCDLQFWFTSQRIRIPEFSVQLKTNHILFLLHWEKLIRLDHSTIYLSSESSVIERSIST